MKIEVVMNSGSRYTLESEELWIENFLGSLYNDAGILKNTLMKLGEDAIYINPNNISSIEVK